MAMPYKSFHEEIEDQKRHFEAVLIKLSNATLVFFYEKEEMRLGTLAVAMPSFGERGCISSLLLGEKNMVLTRVLAERVANASNGIALVSTYLPETKEAEASPMLVKLVQRLIDKADLK